MKLDVLIQYANARRAHLQTPWSNSLRFLHDQALEALDVELRAETLRRYKAQAEAISVEALAKAEK